MYCRVNFLLFLLSSTRAVAKVDADVKVCDVCSLHPPWAPTFYHLQRTDGTGATLQQMIYGAAYAYARGWNYGGVIGPPNRVPHGFSVRKASEFVFGSAAAVLVDKVPLDSRVSYLFAHDIRQTSVGNLTGTPTSLTKSLTMPKPVGRLIYELKHYTSVPLDELVARLSEEEEVSGACQDDDDDSGRHYAATTTIMKEAACSSRQTVLRDVTAAENRDEDDDDDKDDESSPSPCSYEAFLNGGDDDDYSVDASATSLDDNEKKKRRSGSQWLECGVTLDDSVMKPEFLRVLRNGVQQRLRERASSRRLRKSREVNQTTTAEPLDYKETMGALDSSLFLAPADAESRRDQGRPTVAMHIRRGDVNHRSGGMFTPNAYYHRVLDLVVAVFPRADVHAFTSSNSEKEFSDLAHRGVVVHLAAPPPPLIPPHLPSGSDQGDHDDGDDDTGSDGPLSDWRHFIEADLFVMAKSTFSGVPALLTSNCVLYHHHWRAPLSYWLDLDSLLTNNEALRQCVEQRAWPRKSHLARPPTTMDAANATEGEKMPARKRWR